MKAVLLAAGRGSRLGDADLPKPLWEIGPRSLADPTPITILERQIHCLRDEGVEHIAVVVGFRKDEVKSRLERHGVAFVENTHEDIAASGTTHSFRFAVHSDFRPLDGREPCLLLDGDLVYEPAVLRAIVRGEGPSRILVAPATAADDEEVRVYGRGLEPRLIGKGLGPPLTDGLDLLGEAAGVIRFEPGDHALVRSLVDWLCARGFSKIASEHEELQQYLASLGRLGAVRFADDLLFMEADFRRDFERLRSDVYPRILAREGA